MKAPVIVAVLLILALLWLIFLGGVPSETPAEAVPARAAAQVKVKVDVTPPAPPRVSRIVGPAWDLSEVGVRMPIPYGWCESTVRGKRYLMHNSSDPLSGNLCMITLPNIYGKNIDGLFAENTEELGQNPNFKLTGIQRFELDGVQAVRTDYVGTTLDTAEEVRFVGLVFLRAGKQVIVTATARTSDWNAVEMALENALAGLEIGTSAP